MPILDHIRRRWAEAKARFANRYAPVELISTDCIAVCHACNLRHNIRCSVARFTAECADWEHKHPVARGCRTEYLNRRRIIPQRFDDRQWWRENKAPQWMAYGENTNFNFNYRASATITNAITALASSATLVAGYESAIIDNSSNKDLDILISAKVTSGTTPTTNTIIEVSSVSALDDTPNWPDVFDGTTSAETITSVGVKSTICQPYDLLNCDSATTNRIYYMTWRSTAALYGGICPPKTVLFTSHSTAVNLKTEAGTDHVFSQLACYTVGA